MSADTVGGGGNPPPLGDGGGGPPPPPPPYGIEADNVHSLQSSPASGLAVHPRAAPGQEAMPSGSAAAPGVAAPGPSRGVGRWPDDPAACRVDGGGDGGCAARSAVEGALS